MSEPNYALQQAKSQLEYVLELVTQLRTDRDNGDEEPAIDRIHEHPLEVSVRSGWHQPGQPHINLSAAEYLILLCTGGPAVRIIGELDEHKSPITARIEHQDWGTPWTNYMLDSDETEAVLEYASVFFYGE